MRAEQLAFRRRRGEQGQTIFVVVIALVSLLGMAALAIDVVTLYVARAEIQRAADAAALAGAKAIADSGATTDAAYITLAQTMASKVITDGGSNGILQQNLVAGRRPLLVSAVTDFTTHGNNDAIITVTLQQTNLPVFFARIWGRGLGTVSATAMAEAYNPSGSQILLGSPVPIAPMCVKPWLLANFDPANPTSPLINSTSGAVMADIPAEPAFDMIYNCPTSSTCFPTPLSSQQFLPAQVASGTSEAVPSCASSGTDYEQSIAGCDTTAYACGGGTVNATIDTTHANLWNVQSSLECLIHAGGFGAGQGQDQIDASGLPTNPIQITAGSNNPMIGAGSPITQGSPVTTSSSIVTIPIFDTGLTFGNQVRVIGFMQGFVTAVLNPGAAPLPHLLTIKPLNVSGCGNGTATTGPISGGGVSPVPVRLIHP